MAKMVDARGLSCPQPVIMTRNAMKEGQFPIKVIVDTVTSRENVRRVAERAGAQVSVIASEDDFTLTLTK